MPGIFFISFSGKVVLKKVFPSFGVIRTSGLKVLNKFITTFSNPLNTDITIINAIVPTVKPATEIPEIILIIWCVFFEKRYRLAM